MSSPSVLRFVMYWQAIGYYKLRKSALEKIRKKLNLPAYFYNVEDNEEMACEESLVWAYDQLEKLRREMAPAEILEASKLAFHRTPISNRG